MYVHIISPDEWVRATYLHEAVDTSVALKIRYIGSEVAAHVTLAATTGDMTFEQGATTAAADVSTGDNPGASGVLDLTTYTTIKSIIDAINAAADWEAWAVDLPGDYLTNVSAGNGIFTVGGLADQDCTGATGFAVVVDTSLKTAEDFAVGVTLNGPSTTPHCHDGNVLHEVIELRATVTFVGATDGIYVYSCDDITGTKVQIDHVPLVSATATTWSLSGEPIWGVTGKRLVFMAKDASGAITSPTIRVVARSLVLAPGARASRLYGKLSI